MRCFKCADNPILESTSVDPQVTSARCGGCGREIGTVGTKHFRCPRCALKLCQACRLCTKNHFLKKVMFLGNIGTGYNNGNFNCDICKRPDVVDDQGVWHCTPCSFDVCKNCME